VLTTRTIAAAVFSLCLLAPSAALHAQDGFPGDKGPGEWTNDFVLYLWAVNMDVTTTVGPLQVPLDVTFGDLWDKMKFAASGHYEGSNGTWGFLLDAMYVNLGEDGVTVIESPGPGENELLADYRFKTYLAEGAALWSPFESGSSRFDFLGGVRYVGQDLTLDFTSTGPSEPGDGGFDESWWDPIIGVRWGTGWGKYDRWMLRLRSDVGGFGVGSDISVNLGANFGYRLSQLVYLTLGGRYLYTDYETGTVGQGDYWAFEGDMFGLLLGLGFRF
jgi:hypothetical protein